MWKWVSTMLGSHEHTKRKARVVADSRRTDESTKRTDEALKTIDSELAALRARLRLIQRGKWPQ